MRCPQCSNEMVKARATEFGPEYDYCRTCKKELAEMQPQAQEYLIPKMIYPHSLSKALQELREKVKRGMSMGYDDLIPCTPNCGGCSCHINPPCHHCTEAHGHSRSDLGLAPVKTYD